MSDAVIIAIVVTVVIAFVVLAVVLIFKKPLSRLVDRADSADFKMTATSLEAGVRTAAKVLAQESSEAAKSVEAADPRPVEPTKSKQTLPEETAQLTIPENIEAPATIHELFSIGADWVGLISDAKALLEASDIPTPENQSSLGNLLHAFNDERPGLLPEQAENLAAGADQILQKFTDAAHGEVKHEDARLFSNTLSSLHTIISKSASKARHPGYSRRKGNPNPF